MPGTYSYASPTDVNGIPVGSGLVPNVGLEATQGFQRGTDANSVPFLGLYTGDIETAGYAAITSIPANTNAGADTVITFTNGSQRETLVNYSSGMLWYSFDTSTTVAGSKVFQLPPGAGIYSFPKQCSSLHLYTVAATPINAVAPSTNYILVGGAI